MDLIARDPDIRRMRLVAGLRIVLPLAALAILSTLFLFSRPIDPSDAIPFAEVDVESLAREPRLEAPNYAGVTRDGVAVALRAGVVRPDVAQPDLVSAEDIRLLLDRPDGLSAQVSAARGQVDSGAGLAMFEGGVSLMTSTGYTVAAQTLTAELRRTHVVAPSPVTAAAPFGTLDAGSMVLETAGAPGDAGTPAETAAPAYVLVFNDGVRVVYDPQD